MPLLILLIVVPLIEIALFIQVGGLIGLWPTLACVVITAVVGTVLLRYQGMQVLQQAQTSMREDRLPVDSVIHGAFLLAAGLLLLTPGFFTDAVGFALLVPSLRLIVARAIWSRLKGRVRVYGGPGDRPRRPGGGGVVIEGEAEEVGPHDRPDGDDGKRRGVNSPDTPWRPPE